MNVKGNYLKIERLARIRKVVETQGRVTVPDLSKQFDVSEVTIRRDLEELDAKGWVRRTHGGAVRVERVPKEPPMLQRIKEQVTEKQRIGEAAAKLIQNGETIFLGSGTTVLEVARNIPENLSLTVITNSLPVVNTLAERPNVEMIVIGGMLRHKELSMVGHVAEHAIVEFRADRVFVGMRAIDIRHGFTNDYLPEVMTDRAILEIAPQIVVVADHTKFGRVSSVLIAPLTMAQVIVTDRGIQQETVVALQELGIRVIEA